MKLKTIPCFVIAAAISLLFFTQNIAHSASQNPAVSPDQIEKLPNWSDPELAKFVFSVVSIKPFKGDPKGGTALGSRAMPDGYTAAFPVYMLVYEAYRTRHYKLPEVSGWIQSEFYSVEAKMDPEIMEEFQKLPPGRQYIARQHMLQVLLRDYFKVAVRTEIRDIPAYDLVVAKKGSKLKQAADPNLAAQDFKWSTDGTMQLINARGEAVTSLLAIVSGETGRPVYDKTGLTGVYDFALKFTPQRFLMDSQPSGNTAPLPETAPAIEKALEEQLGLKLASTTGQMEFIFIDHAERPSGN